MWQILERNPRAFLWALLLHLALAILLFGGIDWTLGGDEPGMQENLIESSLRLSPELLERVAELRDPEGFKAAREAERRQVEEEQARRAAAAAQAERERQAQEESRRQAELEARREAERAAQREADLRARREAEREAELRAEREAARQAELAARRQAEEQARREAEEQARREAAAEEQARREAEEQAQREAEEQAQREAEEQAQREAEAQAQREAEAAAARTRQLASEWVPRISNRVAQFWIRPQGLRVQVSTLVRLQLNPGGEVVPGSVRVIESSGYPAFDTSVVRAIMDASPLPVPDGEDFNVFKDFDFRFKP